MGVQTDPSKYDFNSSGFATFTDANGNQHTINEQGRETWQSEYNNNVRETNERNAAQRQAAEAKKQQQAEENRRKQQQEEKRRRVSRQRSASGSPGSSMAGFFLGTAGLALPFIFNGILVLVLAVLGKILSPVMPLIELLWELFWMFLDSWFRVFKYRFTTDRYPAFFKDLMCRWVFPVEIVIAAVFLIGALIKCIRGDDYWYEDDKNLKPLIIFPVLELLQSFTTVYPYYTHGHLKSIANGLFLGMWVLIAMGWIIRFIEKRKYH